MQQCTNAIQLNSHFITSFKAKIARFHVVEEKTAKLCSLGARKKCRLVVWDNYTVDSHAEQVTLHSHLPGMQVIKQVIYQLNH